jgi:hypothetical protein
VSHEREDEQVREDGVRPPQRHVKRGTVRQDEGQVQRAVQNDRVVAADSMPPADEREHDHQPIHQALRRRRQPTLQMRHHGWEGRGRIEQPVHEAHHGENQGGDPERAMDRHQQMVVAQGRHHGHTDAQHGQDHGRHHPVQQAREEGSSRSKKVAALLGTSLDGEARLVMAAVTELWPQLGIAPTWTALKLAAYSDAKVLGKRKRGGRCRPLANFLI